MTSSVEPPASPDRRGPLEPRWLWVVFAAIVLLIPLIGLVCEKLR